ncbi:MAG: ATP-binding cassette domain-containing protein [Spirochaetaceae bacterium]|jgi:ABC-type glutathione transport system ATPase component|nr:ATP-binding cassette domain-containing protein [Spirochaetaceae bacterium]
MALLEVRNLSNRYILRGENGLGRKTVKPVLDAVNLDIARGEIFGLVGESGCGKTTLGRCILGLIDYQGEITIGGLRQESRAKARHRRAMARKVQAVFQDPAAGLNPVKKVGWLLEEPLRIHGLGSAGERRRRAEETLELIGLDISYRDRRVDELSSGQKQRVSIGCALMLGPDLIIADEPVSALDVSVGAQILNLFLNLHERLGCSLLFISHNLDLVYYFCDRIAVMEGGRIVEQGPAEQIYSAPKQPYTQKLLEASRLGGGPAERQRT